MSNTEVVFREICRSDARCIHYTTVFSSGAVSEFTGLSKYQVLKALHVLREKGYVKRVSVGCPAVVDYYTGELVEEPHPPVNGWDLTQAGRETEMYKAEEKKALEELAEWAKGKYDKEGELN